MAKSFSTSSLKPPTLDAEAIRELRVAELVAVARKGSASASSSTWTRICPARSASTGGLRRSSFSSKPPAAASRAMAVRTRLTSALDVGIDHGTRQAGATRQLSLTQATLRPDLLCKRGSGC